MEKLTRRTFFKAAGATAAALTAKAHALAPDAAQHGHGAAPATTTTTTGAAAHPA
jgi:gluconate 2-dehydrogenase gamma chain